MKARLFTLVIILTIAAMAIAPGTALAQAYNTSFTTSITYQNVDTSATTSIQILFYPDPTSTTPITITRPNLQAGAGTSVYIGSLSEIAAGFKGSAVLQADKRLVATLVQVPQSTTVKNRPLSNGFSEGASQVLLATILKNTFNTNSRFSVQNTDSEANDVSIKFYNTSASLVHTLNQNIEAGAAYLVDAGTISGLGSSFNGSAVIEATRSGGSDGNIVATSMELSTTGTDASAFEGVAGGGSTFYMPSALCQAFGGYNSAYAVQNTDLATQTNVTVQYSNGATETQLIGPGSKKSFIACNATNMPTNFSGSATITSDTTPVVAIGKVYGLGVSSAFLGSASGDSKLALPYVRWSQSQYDSGQRQRAYIAIQNVGSSSIPANDLKIHYYDKNGGLVLTHTIDTSVAVGAKVNSNPYITSNSSAAEFGYYSDGTFGGSAIVECSAGCEVVAVVRVQSKVPATGQTVGEDYNGIPIGTP